MKTAIMMLVLLFAVAGALDPADARPRRPKKQVEYYTFSPTTLDDRVAPYAKDYDRVGILNEMRTEVSEGEAVCHLDWTVRQVLAVTDPDAHSVTLAFPMPRGARLEEQDLYLVDKGGKEAQRIEKPIAFMKGDTLTVSIPDLGSARVVDWQIELDGEGVTVDETFLFQPAWPVLRGEYTFSVERDLWQEAADQGLNWQFSATTEPLTWAPTRSDTPEFFSWYWRKTNTEPVKSADVFQDARRVSVTGYLPAPALAGFDPEKLPDLASLDKIRDLEDQLRLRFERMERDTQVTSPAGGGSGSGSGAGGTLPPVPVKR